MRFVAINCVSGGLRREIKKCTTEQTEYFGCKFNFECDLCTCLKSQVDWMWMERVSLSRM